MAFMTLRSDLRHLARQAFDLGVDAADPNRALARALNARPIPVGPDGKLFIVSVGKAAIGLVETAMSRLSSRPVTRAIAVTNYENERPIAGVEVFGAAHPVPDENGAKAARAVMGMVSDATAEDLVLCLISGGASALLPAPVPGLTLADKIAVNEMLLSSGLDIQQMNLVRQSLSQLKGGGLRRLAAPAQVCSFILSDVLGDDLRAIGSGPSVAPIGPVSDARDLLQQAGLWQRLPAPVQSALSRPDDPDLPQAPQAYLIGSNALSLQAMAKAASAEISTPDLEGDVADAADRVVTEARATGPKARIAFGGETTVTLTGTGRGGRNQELAIRVALEAQRQGLDGPWCFLSGGTDGRDGPTDAAGGLVDDTTLDRLAAGGVQTKALLANNDSYAILQAAEDLLMTGATGTNVADLQILLRG